MLLATKFFLITCFAPTVFTKDMVMTQVRVGVASEEMGVWVTYPIIQYFAAHQFSSTLNAHVAHDSSPDLLPSSR